MPFLWEHADQPDGRWHQRGEGPTQYLSDTPDGAWAEFLRHEEIFDPADVAGVRRALWAMDLPDVPERRSKLPASTLHGGPESYAPCQKEAQRLRARGSPGLIAPSAALVAGGARGARVNGGLKEGPARDGRTIVLFGRRPDLVAWAVVEDGRPPVAVLDRVRHFRSANQPPVPDGG